MSNQAHDEVSSSLNDAGLDEATRATLESLRRSPGGIMVVGATGMGKTSYLTDLLKSMNDRG
jgi:type II secretory ATPase GspE/PulE/Tfp pilus assembly ATPase PilB-like protein